MVWGGGENSPKGLNCIKEPFGAWFWVHRGGGVGGGNPGNV